MQILFYVLSGAITLGVPLALAALFAPLFSSHEKRLTRLGLGLIPAEVAGVFKTVSKFLMVCALAAIGLNTSFAKLCKSGAKPMLHGFIISLLVVLVAIAVEYALGIAPGGVIG